jgi:hypothetical protein
VHRLRHPPGVGDYGQKDGRAFLLASNDLFRPGAPPALDSPEFLAALAEVRAYGQDTSSARTPAQTVWEGAHYRFSDKTGRGLGPAPPPPAGPLARRAQRIHEGGAAPPCRGRGRFTPGRI